MFDRTFADSTSHTRIARRPLITVGLLWMTLGTLLCSPIWAHQNHNDLTCQVEGLDAERIEQARRLLEEVPLIDGHNDLPWALRRDFDNQLGKVDLRKDLSAMADPDHTDLVRLRKGGLGAQFWSVYVPVNLPGSEAVQTVVEQIDVVHRLIELYPEAFTLALTADDIERQFKEGKIASLIGIEGGHSIHNSLAVLRQLYLLGARYMTITHWQNIDWADSATDDPENDGLSPFGEEVIREMNRLGMIVDLSHVSEATMHDTLDVSAAPVIFSHSSARSVTAHSRNVPDSVLERVQSKDGVVMVTFVPVFISEELRQHSAARQAEEARLESLHLGAPKRVVEALETWDTQNPRPHATLSQVADHIDYLKQKVGVDHIGIGSDYDGITTVPAGLEDVSCFPALFGELLRRGYSTAELKSIAGLNVLRVMRAVEATAAAKRQETARDTLIADLDCQEGKPCKYRQGE